MKTTHIVIGAALVGGYLYYQDQKKRELAAAQQAYYQQQPQSALSSIFSGIVTGIASAFSGKPKVVSQTGTQTVPSTALTSSQYASGTYRPFTPDTGIPKSTLGSLGSYGDRGSLGGCRGSLGCGKYGSLS